MAVTVHVGRRYMAIAHAVDAAGIMTPPSPAGAVCSWVSSDSSVASITVLPGLGVGKPGAQGNAVLDVLNAGTCLVTATQTNPDGTTLTGTESLTAIATAPVGLAIKFPGA